MKILNYVWIVLLFTFISCGKSANGIWVSSVNNNYWQEEKNIVSTKVVDKPLSTIISENKEQQIEGFGACFNELGWTSLNLLSEKEKQIVLGEFFNPGEGANFTICRMPVAANDFSRDWYSYNENENDFDMKSFSIDNDKETLIPFIKSALKYNPNIRLWASPWCPPSWMKVNKHYACRSTMKMYREQKKQFDAGESTYMTKVVDNGLSEDKEGFEGSDMFICKPEFLKAYALYFSKFIDAYRKEGIKISMVMPQNEFNSSQIFPSCCWTAAGLADFVGHYLGPMMDEKGVDVMFGTMERPNVALVDTILNDSACKKYIKGVGFQWAGKESIKKVHEKYPNLNLYQTEQECGDGKNTWDSAMYSWNLMQHYLNNGASAYMYWNISLEEGGISRWGWAQNSLVVVDKATKSYRFTPEYYVMKHVSHFVKPGAMKLAVEGQQHGIMAFENPDRSIVLIISNDSDNEMDYPFSVNGKTYSPTLAPNSLNTFVL